jgi:hypothetical protein
MHKYFGRPVSALLAAVALLGATTAALADETICTLGVRCEPPDARIVPRINT